VVGIGIVFLIPSQGAGAVALCILLSLVVGGILSQTKTDKVFLLQVFVGGLLARVIVGSLIFYFNVQSFFGGDAFSYDFLGATILTVWEGELQASIFNSMLGAFLNRNWGMIYVVGAIYSVLGRNMLAVQFFSAVLGAATAPIIYFCAQHIFQNSRVARLSAYAVAFFPSMILWSAQGLKDGPLVFLLAISMLATLKLGEKLNVKYLVVLAAALFCIFTLRFYVFYMMVASIAGAFAIGLSKMSAQSIVRQFIIVIFIGLAMIQLGVLNSARGQFEDYANLEAIQRSRLDLAKSGQSGFGQDVDVSTTSGALAVIPLGMVYLLFAPFPWQLASLRQVITLPEMLIWWSSFPLLMMGLWFTLKYRIRQALPILIFTTMLTIAYSVFQGNVGTAYRQRSQLLIFYFIFVSVGYALVKERKEDKRRQEKSVQVLERQSARSRTIPVRARSAQEKRWIWEEQKSLELGRRKLLDPVRGQAYAEFRDSMRDYFLEHPAATEEDFERCWPELRDRVFRQQTHAALSRLPAPLHVLLSNGHRRRREIGEFTEGLVLTGNGTSHKHE
jgi:hypothetical protein